MKTVFYCLAALFATVVIAPVYASELTVQMVGLENTEGAVLYAVFDEAKAFPAKVERAVASGYVELAHANDLTLHIPLKPGRYPIALVHDQNLNGRLDLGAFDIPVEGFGFSNNPDSSRGAPSFKDSAINFTDATQSVEISISY